MVSLSTSNDASQGHQNNTQHSSSESTTSVIYSGNDPSRQAGPPLGLLHDDKAGHHLTESKDITILRRLKHAILEGQHPYFKANIDLSNLQDLVLTSGSRSTIPPATGHQINSSGTLNLITAQQTPHNLPSTYTNSSRSAVVSTLDSQNEQGNGTSDLRVGAGPQRNATQAPTEDVNMDQAETSVDSKVAEGNVHAGLPRDLDPDKKRGPSHTLGRYTLHSPIESTPTKHSGHKRKISDTPTLLDSGDKKDEPEIEIKRESPPYQFLGSQSQAADPSSSSIASFVSSASTALTSEDGIKSDAGHNVDADVSGYDPKYGDKTEFLRRQKVRTRMIESIEEKNRRSANRPEERSTQKSPVRPSENGDRQSGARNVSPVRGREHPSRTHTQPTSRTADASGQGAASNNTRRTPPPGAANERPPSNFETSPRGRPPAPSFARAVSPPPGKYPRPRDYSPPRDYRPQYLPYDDPRSSRPRPVVSSPPRGSPPREPPAPRAASHRQSLDNYPGSFRGNESRSFDSRPPPTSPVFADRPRAGSYSVENDNWAGSARGRPAPPPSRSSPPSRDSSCDRTPFGSSNLPPNPAAGHRPRGLPDPAGSRYDPYDPASGRESSWPPSRDWTASSRLPDSKPKLQDRLTADSTWSREMTGSRPRDDFPPRPLRDDFAPRPNDDYPSRYRREPSPLRYSDGLRAGFSRPSEIEGIRPMKRSRPDDGYPPRGGPGPDRARYDMDARPLGGDYYREVPRRIDDEYEPRTRPPYGGWAP